MTRKLLLYGGAFNPPHLGHERLLANAIQKLNPDLTLVTPSEVSPHKTNGVVPFAERAHLCRTFLSCGERVKISGMENSGRRRKSYTFQTVKRLQKKYSAAEIFLLIGSDMLFSFESWHLWRRLLATVTLVAAPRSEEERGELAAACALIEKQGGRVVLLEIEPTTVSSTEIRARLAGGGDVDGLVSDFVATYAKKRELY